MNNEHEAEENMEIQFQPEPPPQPLATPASSEQHHPAAPKSEFHSETILNQHPVRFFQQPPRFYQQRPIKTPGVPLNYYQQQQQFGLMQYGQYGQQATLPAGFHIQIADQAFAATNQVYRKN